MITLSSIANHLWQSTLFVAAIWLLTLILRKNHARIRYWLWFAASLKFLIPFSLLISIGNSIDLGWGPEPTATSTERSFIQIINQPFEAQIQSFVTPTTESPGPSPSNWIPVLVPTVWLCGSLVVLLTWWRRSRRVSNSIRHAEPLTDDRIINILQRFTGSSKVCIPIRLGISNTMLEPGVFGIIRPVLMVPAGISNRLEDAQLEAILAHELSHVRNRDNFFAAIHMFVEAVFWFYPVVWWLGSKLVEERERACDEAVLQLGNEPQTYADGILKVCEFYLESPLACVSGVIGSNLKKRIEGIMLHRVGAGLSVANKLLLAGAGVAALAAPLLVGAMNAPQSRAQSQDESNLSFEVASVKPSGVTFGMSVGNSPGRFYVNGATLNYLITKAYDLQEYQLSGGPKWMDSSHFNVEGKYKGVGAVRFDQVMIMLQSLIVERFKLKFHRETREMLVYRMIVAKGGHKLQQSKDENGNPLVTLPDSISAKTWGPGLPIIPGTAYSSDGELGAGGTSLAKLARILTQTLKRKVIDETGIGGLYDVRLKWTSSKSQSNPLNISSSDNPGLSATGELGSTSIFTAIQEQLGLKLESDKGPVEFFVIDSVEKPSEN